ncbi:MAG: 6-bladed beta-propeller [Rikenellaceae bacterium]|nr:6-bladed beta-propeller [Rikenellaceae bacterium]
MKRFAVIAIFILSIISCSEDKPGKRVFTYDEIKSADKTITLNETGREWKFITLETTTESQVGYISCISRTKERLYIVSANPDNLFVFSQEGKFIKKISNCGRGPGEFFSIRQIYIDEEKDLLVMFDLFKIMLFDLDGNHIKDIPHKPCFNDGMLLGNGNILLNKQVVQGTESVRLVEFSQKGDTLATNKNNFFFESENIISFPQYKSFNKDGKDIIYHQQFQDTVYTYNQRTHELEYRYSFNFDRKESLKYAFSDLKNRSKGLVLISNYIEDSNYIYLDLYINTARHNMYLISKQNDSCYKADFRYTDGLNLTFYPKWVSGDAFIDFVDISNMNYTEKNQDSTRTAFARFLASKGCKNTESLDECSNPVIVIAE